MSIVRRKEPEFTDDMVAAFGELLDLAWEAENATKAKEAAVHHQGVPSRRGKKGPVPNVLSGRHPRGSKGKVHV